MYNPEVTYKINKCLFDVYNNLGNIWSEETYENALEIAFNEVGFQCRRQVEFDVYYYNYRVGVYRMDLIMDDMLIIELKALPQIFPVNKAQIISYLKGTKKPIGLLVNFGQERKVFFQYFPNKVTAKCLDIHFDKEKTNIQEQLPLLLLEKSKAVLEYLGPGYFHQVYQRAMNYELRMLDTPYQKIFKIEANFRGQLVGAKEVRLFKIEDLLYAPVAVTELTDNILNKFVFYMKHTNSKKGLIVNFHSINLDYRYFDVK